MKKLLILIVYFIALFSIVSCNAQDDYDKLLVGKWSGVKKEAKNGRSTLNNGEIIKEISIYEFQNGGLVIDYTDKSYPNKFEYLIKGEILGLGSLSFKIEKLDKENLIIIDYNENDPKNPLVFRHYFKRATYHK